MRYKLMSKHPDDTQEEECIGKRKTTKKQVEQWCQDNIKGCGLDWRVGFTIKLRDSCAIYTWRWIKDNTEVKFNLKG